MKVENRRHAAKRAIVLASPLLVLGLGAPLTYAAKTYYIDEGTGYTGNGCTGGDLNDVTSSLKTALDSNTWSGSRYTNSSAWPQDFWESCTSGYGANGLDSLYGDTKFLSVFAGHGSTRTLWFTHPRESACTTEISNNSRLGAMNGSSAGFGMWLACEILQSGDLGTSMHQSMRQQVGFRNVIGIGDDEPRDFFNATNTKTNAQAWLDQMGTGGRQAIVATFSRTSGNDCWSVHNAAKLRADVHNSPMGGGATCGGAQPLYHYCYETVN